MSNKMPSSDAPQFGKAEYAPQQTARACALCGRELGADYYRVKNAIACESCAIEAKSAGGSDTHSAFVKAVMLGVGAAIIGMICYAAFTITTGIEIGYLSLGVGFLVGKAMKLGSGGMGGRRYQIAAVILTYAAVSLAAIPIAVSQYSKAPQQQPPAAPRQSASNDPGDAPTSQADASDNRTTAGHRSVLAIVGSLVFVGLASPFLELQADFVNGAIGLVILFVGIQFAWKLTAGSETPSVMGPFANRAGAPAPPRPL